MGEDTAAQSLAGGNATALMAAVASLASGVSPVQDFVCVCPQEQQPVKPTVVEKPAPKPAPVPVMAVKAKAAASAQAAGK
jgi:hypothetical protein